MYKYALTLTALLAACRTNDTLESQWIITTALDAGTKLGGCAGGDLVAERAGDEIAVVAGDGATHVVWHEGDTFRSTIVATTAGEMIQCAIGDIVAEHPGQELVIVGMQQGAEDDGGAGEAHVLWSEGDEWVVQSLFIDNALIHGVAAGDVDPRRAGDEVLLVGYSQLATLVYEHAGAWQVETIAKLPGPGKNAVAWNGGAAIACSDGSLVFVAPGEDEWTSTVIGRSSAGWARLGTDGERLVAARDDGALFLFQADGSSEIVHQENEKLRGAVLADLDPSNDEAELATAGYEMRATVLTPSAAGWTPETVYTDDARFHHATCAELDGIGQALFVCGYSGRVTAIWRSR